MQSGYREKPSNVTAELLECYIKENHLQPNDRLPAERKLCEMWNVSRSTVRKAVKRLEVEGKLYSIVGSGNYVATPKFVRSLQDIENRGMQSRVQKYGKNISSMLLSKEIIESTRQISLRLHVVLGHKIFVISRLRLIDGIPGWIETSYLDAQRFAGIEMHDFTQESLYEVIEDDYEVKLTQGRQNIGITYTTEEESEILKIPEETAVFYVSSIVCGEDGEPVEYCRSVVRSDQVCFLSKLRQISKAE